MRRATLLLIGALALSAPLSSHFVPGAAADARAPASCGTAYYVNVRGACVHRPVRSNSAPAGASAKCRDGTYSLSQNRRGTCSGHGGVAVWL